MSTSHSDHNSPNCCLCNTNGDGHTWTASSPDSPRSTPSHHRRRRTTAGSSGRSTASLTTRATRMADRSLPLKV
uniref:Uncharacterized protein n=1 Tax=Rhizophora mucronata TaxID=61149 RepID=A0A2P2K479_RHIMU